MINVLYNITLIREIMYTVQQLLFYFIHFAHSAIKSMIACLYISGFWGLHPQRAQTPPELLPGPRLGTSVSQTPCAHPDFRAWLRHCLLFSSPESVSPRVQGIGTGCTQQQSYCRPTASRREQYRYSSRCDALDYTTVMHLTRKLFAFSVDVRIRHFISRRLEAAIKTRVKSHSIIKNVEIHCFKKFHPLLVCAIFFDRKSMLIIFC